MKVLVTGAAGSLGRATCEALQGDGVEFVATDVRTHRDLPYPVRVVNLVEREACYAVVEGCDTVVHIANHPHPHAANPQRLFTENNAMNINIFQAALETGARKIIYASSIQAMNGGRFGAETTVPSRLKYLPLDGDAPAQPANAYAASKVAGEVLLRCMAEHQGLESGVAVRLPALVRQDHIRWLHEQINGGGRGLGKSYLDEGFSWLSYNDGGRLLLAIVKASLPGYRCYLPATAQPLLSETIPAIIARFYPNVPLRCPADQMPALVDISRITRDTGWAPQDDVSHPAS